MRKAFIAMMYVLIFALQFCGGESIPTSEISGFIHNLEAEELRLNGHAVELDPSGRFLQTLEITKPGFAELEYGKTLSLYLVPGDRLQVEIDADAEIGSTKVSGDRLEINRFLVADSQESARASAYFSRNIGQPVALEADAYVEKIDGIWRPFQQRFEGFLSEQGSISKDFIKSYRAALQYSRANLLLSYPQWHRQAAQAWDYEPPLQFYDFLEGMEPNDPALLDLEEYTRFLEQYLAFRTGKLLEDPSSFSTSHYRPIRAKMQACLDIFRDPEVRDAMLYSFMPLFLTEHSHKGTEDLVASFRDSCSRHDYIQEIDRLLAADKAVRDGCRITTYKEVGNISLDAFVYLPEGHSAGDNRTAIAFFHGGGWDVGKPEWGRMQCEHFASLGMVAVSFEYRLLTKYDATPVEGIADARSALRWMRAQSQELGIDPARIVASGYSAGGHLALCATMIDRFDEPGDDLNISPKADAFLLWVTPAKIFESVWFRKILKGQADIRDCDPIQHIKPGLPPAIMFQGTIDDDVPPWTARAFAEAMSAAGNRCDLHIYEGQTHLNWGDNVQDVLSKMDTFLESIGFKERYRP